MRFVNIRWAGLDLVATNQTFLPRESSLGLLEAARNVLARGVFRRPTRLIDMCCGSGALGIAIYLANRPCFESVYFLDSSPQAVASAEANRAAHGVPGWAKRWRAGEALTPCEPALVICNPPFMEPSSARQLAAWERKCVSSPKGGLAVIGSCFQSLAGSGHSLLLKCLFKQIRAVTTLTRAYRMTQVYGDASGETAFSFWSPEPESARCVA
ncbi:MAG: methyltransferase [Acidobacteriaceae bacterium]|nr:methyltransferase [Acidobacteriaceae bacterium]